MGAGMGRIRKKKIDQLLFLMLNATLKYVADEFAAFLGTNEQVKVTFASNVLYLVSTPQKFSPSRTRGCRCLCEASHIKTYVWGGAQFKALYVCRCLDFPPKKGLTVVGALLFLQKRHYASGPSEKSSANDFGRI